MSLAGIAVASDLREAAIARLFEPVDKARAVFRGLTIVGHRSSVPAGEMIWAMHGGSYAYDAALRRDPTFVVLDAPHPGWLRDQQPVLEALS